MAAHSTFSASAASRWMACPGSVVLSEGLTERASRHAAEGTVAHTLLEWCLVQNLDACHREWVGAPHVIDGHEIVVDDDMLDHVNTALRNIREMTAAADMLQAETRVNYATWLEVPEEHGFGTADVIALAGAELQVHDLKYGRGVEVDAERNAQLMLYAAGALREFEAFASVETVRLVIHQPRVRSAPSEWSLPAAELKAWLTSDARSAAASVRNAQRLYPDATEGSTDWHETFLRPGDTQCRWCKAKATCPALRNEVAEIVGGEIGITEMFQPVAVTPTHSPDSLAVCLSKVDLIEDWCKAVRAEAERRLMAGEPVPGFKVVAGKRGNRTWRDAKAAEEYLRKTARLTIEQAYDLKLISPTTAEKLAKAGEIGPRQWAKLQEQITQPDGKPHVAPVTDPRPALEITPVDTLFDVQSDDLANLV